MNFDSIDVKSETPTLLFKGKVSFLQIQNNNHRRIFIGDRTVGAKSGEGIGIPARDVHTISFNSAKDINIYVASYTDCKVNIIWVK